MIEKIQSSIVENFSGWLTLTWVIGISIWGGTVSYLHKLSKYGIPFSLFKFIAEIVTAGFVGLITYLLCQSSGLSMTITAALVGISGHMGTRALFILEKKYESFFGKESDEN